ncbi:hypothetical protein P3T37_004350 [Kitasatospora sp. MAA4]|uniref:hypothetical protein n=1 Tax=Kitasatospora sp. MAA4 TaxID=3035093 RepID=UPI002476C371|nr:hypothetical protein [Kitasatospora sp. MAA4]MDH6134941.1 hypothetical protein [Kitasatospora sp. MAA4]
MSITSPEMPAITPDPDDDPVIAAMFADATTPAELDDLTNFLVTVGLLELCPNCGTPRRVGSAPACTSDCAEDADDYQS